MIKNRYYSLINKRKKVLQIDNERKIVKNLIKALEE
jgi:hypothetical protein